jgi:hypothetical protein
VHRHADQRGRKLLAAKRVGQPAELAAHAVVVCVVVGDRVRVDDRVASAGAGLIDVVFVVHVGLSTR